MGLFDFIKKAQEKVDSLQKRITDNPSAVLSEIVKPKAKQAEKSRPNSTGQKIVSMFYANYPEIPYISDDRKEEWIEMAETFPNIVPVHRNMMVRYRDGLLPGHIYMLYWLNKYTNKKVPAYFEYRYGINFDYEKAFLIYNGYLNSMDKPTEKGMDAIKKHEEVIAAHSQKPDRSIEGISNQILAARDNIKKNGFSEYTFHANHDCCEICARLHEKHFPIFSLQIGVNAPPMHEGCRCSISAYSDDAEYEAWSDYLENGGTTAEWNRTGKAKWEKTRKQKK